MALRMSALAALVVAMLAAPASAQDVERGREIFVLCTQCHLADGGGSQLALAPAIAGLPQWYVLAQLQKFRAGYRGQHFDDIAGMRMRPMSLALANDNDVASGAAYVASLAPLVSPGLVPRTPARKFASWVSMYQSFACVSGGPNTAWLPEPSGAWHAAQGA